ncbi:uncharacterized protein LOC6643180 [Drosophila willistoni]|uniref:uncharacterized protein LOC6643180 n=1 Tax=Drosophila willistoni TaxID=7260 RepID=UPI000C26C513|nr:uncharacterized protein LOC6643180 [Drosophila willistoni]
MPLSQGGYHTKHKRALKTRRNDIQPQESLQQHHLLAPSTYLANRKRSSPNSMECATFRLLEKESSLCNYSPRALDELIAAASRQNGDGSLPLDKLSPLTSRLTQHIRQLGEDGAPQQQQQQQPAPPLPPPLATHSVESRYQHLRQRQQMVDNWTAHTLGLDLSMGNGGMEDDDSAPQLRDLYAPTREQLLSVPSPIMSEDYDPLMCPLCRDILRCPVTTNCGHTFCRQCCETITQCNICQVKFPGNASIMAAGTAVAAAAGTTTTTTSSGGAGTRFFAGLSSSGAAGAAATSPFFPSYALHHHQRPLPPSPSPTTVTTTTVASTTATATTTMASTSTAAALAAANGYGRPMGIAMVGQGAGAAGLGVGVNVSAAGSSASSMKFMPDVLVRNLIEKWWGQELQARKICEKATSCMHVNRLDDALKFCNASLEKAPTDFKSLVLRAEVLLKLNHYQSSLADIENALRTRCTSPKAHYLRALALSGLGRLEEALYNGFLAICLDKNTNLSNSEIFQHDLSKILQRLLAQTPKSRGSLDDTLPTVMVPQARHNYPSTKILWEPVRRRRKHHHHHHHVRLDDVEDEFGHYIMSGDDEDVDEDVEDVEDVDRSQLNGDFLFPSALDYMEHDHHHHHLHHNQKQFELHESPQQRRGNRKHCKRKWSSSNRDEDVDREEQKAKESRRCNRLLAGVLERTRQELQRLRKVNSGSPQSLATAVPSQLIDASDFDCVLCCRTLWKPVVTPCGHTYCLVCLDRCMDYNSSCPLCMSPLVELNVNNNTLYQGSSSPVPFALAKRPVTKFLEAAMKRFIPDHYEARFRQEIDQEPSVPVFICTAAFPSVPCPLFVCDPRYRLMVRRALESGEKTFGIVQPHGGKSRYYDVGTILDIRDCVLLGDGCSILSTIGCKRFKILARSEKDGYETAKVEYICDEPIAMDQVKSLAGMQSLVMAKATGWFDSLSTEQKHEILQSYGQMPPLEANWERITDGPAWAWWIIALLPLSQQLKVDILATTSLKKRLRAIDKMLDWLLDLNQPQQQPAMQSTQSPHEQPHELSNHHHLEACDDHSESEAAAAAAANADECCLYAANEGQSDPHTDEDLLL